VTNIHTGLLARADVAVENHVAIVVADEEIVVVVGVYVGEGWHGVPTHVNALP